MTPEQERVSSIVMDTISLLCKNSLSFSMELKIEGLIGITTDGKDVFLIHLDELFRPDAADVLKQEPVDPVDFHSERQKNPPQTPNRNQGEMNPGSRSASNHWANQPMEEQTAYGINPKIKSEVTDYNALSFHDLGYMTAADVQPHNNKVKLMSSTRTAKISYGRDGANISSVANEVTTESYMDDVGLEFQEVEDPPEEDGLVWDSASDNLFPFSMVETEHETGSMLSPKGLPYGFGRKTKASVRGRGRQRFHGQSTAAPALGRRLKHSDTNPYVINETSHLCGYPECGKRFRFRHDLLRHQTKKHGRMPQFRGRGQKFQMDGMEEYG